LSGQLQDATAESYKPVIVKALITFNRVTWELSCSVSMSLGN